MSVPQGDLQESMNLANMKDTIRNSNMMSHIVSGEDENEDDESFSSSSESSDAESDMDEIGDEQVDVDKVMTYYTANLSEDAIKFWANQKELEEVPDEIEDSEVVDPNQKYGPPYEETTLQTLKTAFRGT